MSERESRAQAAEAALPPSKAGRPKTDASETSPQLKTPTPVKASPASEAAASAREPEFDEKAANLAAPSVEKEVKQRRRKSSDAGVVEAKSPELLRGEPIGPDSKRLAGEKRAPKGEPSPDARKPTGRKR